MPSSPRSTLVPVRRTTHARLAERKGASTFDAVILALLDQAPPAPAPVDAERPRPAPVAEPRESRTPEKQLLLAGLAVEAWAARVRSGELAEIGPRLVDWTPAPPEEVALVFSDGRGFAP
ncbi:MAG TPA: hypothetical protein VM370_02180 [Candidatus Thermoplasmatota archaeon]|nr:hypothetical protein [Candidatus Thermoplasmatota archaeon]